MTVIKDLPMMTLMDLKKKKSNSNKSGIKEATQNRTSAPLEGCSKNQIRQDPRLHAVTVTPSGGDLNSHFLGRKTEVTQLVSS